MKKAFLLLLLSLLLCACVSAFPAREKAASMTSEEATKVFEKKTRVEVMKHWGKPDSMLSGFFGDIYVYERKLIVFYYDENERITNVLIGDKDPSLE